MNTSFGARLLPLAGMLLALSSSSPAIDLDMDGLSDVWEQQYGAESLLAGDDTDGDGFTNLGESAAGTDPFDSNDHPKLEFSLLDPEDPPLVFTFPTQAGKLYQFQDSLDLQIFRPVGEPITGDSTPLTLALDPDNASSISGNVIQQFWADLSGNDLTTLTNDPNFPDSPDGETRLSSLEPPLLSSSGFGFRMTTLVSPPQTGDYSFFLSSGSSAELSLSSDDSSTNLALIAQLLSGQSVAPNQFDSFSNQRSDVITLNAGQSYLLEVISMSSTPKSHCQIAWTGPGITGTQIIDSSHIASYPFLSDDSTDLALLEHDYDEMGETSPIIQGNVEIVTAPAGMSGQAERLRPSSSSALSTYFPETNDHLFFSVLVNVDPSNENVSLFLKGSGNGTEGPRIDFDLSNSLPAIRAGGSGGTAVAVPINANQTYRLEVLAALDTPFDYSIGLAAHTVQPDSFDLYVSDTNGNLVASHSGLTFRDGANAVDVFQRFQLLLFNEPDITFDDWFITDGVIDSRGYISPNVYETLSLADQHFFRLQISDGDQDGDGITDSEEHLLAPHNPFLFFDSETSAGTTDTSAATNLMANSNGPITLSLQGSDVAAFEDNSPNIDVDNATVVISRTGPLTAVDAKLCIAPLANTGNTSTICDGLCCTLVGSAGDEAAEVEDYTLVDEDGQVITDTVSFEFGEMSKTLTVIATNDGINEYPETLNLALYPDSAYEISSTINGASIQLFDLPDSPSNYAIFTGLFSQDGAAVITSPGSGSTTAILNGPRTKLFLTTEFTGLTSNQQDAHIHKSNPGTLASERVGDIIYAITNVPGAEGSNPPDSDPKLGPLNNYEWDLADSAGAVPTAGGAASKQTVIDSLFGQSGETPLYFNVHTVSNPAGEIWSFLELTGGSVTDPGEPIAAALPGSTEFPQLFGEDLSAEVRRFLDQATFGATEEEVAILVSSIENERLTDASYHRQSAFDSWMDAQMAVPQHFHVDYQIASNFQQMKLRGWFDPALNPSDGTTNPPSLPASWPVIDRSNPDPTKWHLTGTYPATNSQGALAQANGRGTFLYNTDRRTTHTQMMTGAPDQLRQKMGFALQQIVVVSVVDDTLRNSPMGSSNYQDQLNYHAFSHYRDILGFVNWSPIMGNWLSSIQNQKGLDIDGDGLNDTFPDENLARENMQLFSIGLFELWPDGTLRLGSDGAPNNTYTNDDIREFAKVITGQSFSVSSNPWGGDPFDTRPKLTSFNTSQGQSTIYGDRYNYPLQMFGDYHDRSIKTFAGTTIDNTNITDATEHGIADMEDALNWLAGKPGDGNPDFDMVHSHGSTPAFICRRLIQRFVKSNPSREYLHRVATAFKNNEGDLALTLKAILLDPEARVIDLNDSSIGMKRSPLECYIQLIRKLGAFTYIPFTPSTDYPFDNAPGDYSNPDIYITNFGYPMSQATGHRLDQRLHIGVTNSGNTSSLMMESFYQETVFNWYLPDYAPSGSVSNAGLVAPEMQLANEQDVIRNINYFRQLFVNSNGVFGLPFGGSITPSQKTAFNVTDNSANSYHSTRLDFSKLVNELYPPTPPTPTGSETAEYLANLSMLDELDRRLNYGHFKERYPIDPADDGPDGIFQNPRELILSAVTYGGDNPYDGNNDYNNRLNRIQDVLYLIVASPEFQVRK
ncbi:MAG: DUF1800 family protein [Roseibacillus sp.]